MSFSVPQFCSACGGPLIDGQPEGDDRIRRMCPSCGFVHYENPRMVVGCVVERDEEILLCRRAIKPRHGHWTIPAGYLEVGEGLAAGARRETHEEAGLEVEIVAPHALLDLTHIGQSYTLFRAVPLSDRLDPGVESLDARWFHSNDIPWDDLAFPAIHFALRLRLEDRQRGRAPVHSAVVTWRGSGSRWDVDHYDLADHVSQAAR